VKHISSSASGLGFLTLFLLSPLVRGQDAITPPTSASAPAATDRTSSWQGTAAYSSLVNSPARFGLGLNVGNLVTGVTAKLRVSSAVAVQATVGEGPEGNNFRGHIDLLFSPGTWTSPDGQYVLPMYLGIGGVLDHQFAAGQSVSYSAGGFRVPVGMSVLVRGNPVELFLEIAPEFVVRGNSTLQGKYVMNADGSIGVRYFF
jgi:hypothetical protein